MPKINVKYPVFKNGTKSGIIGKSVRADFAPTIDKARFYAEGELEEAENLFIEGLLTYEVDDLLDETEADILAHDVTNGEVTANVDDITPYTGTGFYAVMRKKGVYKYRAVWFPKVLFDEPNDNNTSRSQNISYGTTVLTGTAFKDENGNWRIKKTFDIEAEVIAWLNTLAELPVSASAGLSDLSIGGVVEGDLSPMFDASTRYYSFAFTTNEYITISATAEDHTIKLYVDGVYLGDLSAEPYLQIQTPTVKSYKVVIIAQEAGKAPQTTEIIIVKTA